MRAFIIFCIAWAFLALKCNTNWQERKNTKIDLVGFFDKNYARVKLGDTLTFTVKIPDTATVRKLEDNTMELIPIQSLQQADIAFRVRRIDTVSNNHNSCGRKEISVILRDKIQYN